jgi:hypothetical protein
MSLRTMGMATTPTIGARARGRPPEEMITIFTFGKRCPRRRLPKAPTAAATTTVATTMVMRRRRRQWQRSWRRRPFRDASDVLCGLCHSISELYATVNECFQAMEAMRQRMEDLERVVEDDYKFLNRNMRKLFSMVGNMRGKWCNSCGK